jgi:GNAT superfamily N-acetyltransferase
MTKQESFTIRKAEPHDSGIIAHHRAAMFRDMGLVPTGTEFELLREASESWLASALTANQYVGWFVLDESDIAAGGGVLIREQFPVPGCYRVGRWAHVMNVYTEPEYRRRGWARRLMRTILEWCEAEEINHVTLTASDEGRPLYESLGFRQAPEMRLAKLR